MRTAEPDAAEVLARRHLRWGWWSLLVFLSLGAVLEGMHALKVDWYLDVGNETRRLLWTLAHAHGALLGLLHLAFAFTLRASCEERRAWRGTASAALIGASLLLPGGFLLGGWTVYGGDPGPAILLVPAGGLLLFLAVLLIAWRARFP